MAYSPDGRRLGTIEEDGTLRLWNAANGVEQWAMQRWEEANSLAFSHDGKFVAGSGARFPPDASYEVDQAVFDVDIGEVVASLVGHEDWTPGLVFALDGRVVTASIDGTARVWDVATGDVQATLHHDTGVTHVAGSACGGAEDERAGHRRAAADHRRGGSRGVWLGVWSLALVVGGGLTCTHSAALPSAGRP